MQSHNIKRIHKWKKSTAVGRGGKRGKTSGRGTKGQNARAGRKLRPEIRDVIMRLPKLRGRGTNSFVSRHEKPVEIKLGELNNILPGGGTIDLELLIKTGFLGVGEKRRGIKIIGGGSVEKAFNIIGVLTTKSVKEAIEKAGGSVK